MLNEKLLKIDSLGGNQCISNDANRHDSEKIKSDS